MRAMKDSGVEWIGRIPEDWKVYKVKQIIARNDGGIWGNDPTFQDTDVIVLRSTEQTIDGKWDLSSPALRDLGPEENYSEYVLKENDLLITKSSGSELHIGKTTIVDKEVAGKRCCYSNFMQRIRARSSISARLLWYFFNSIILREQFCYFSNTTSGLNNINASMINNASISLPSLSGQLRIVTFLDAKCAQIDAIIEKQQQVIEKLKAYKQSVITEAVTKGLDSTVPMKDSGVEWIGKIPQHWIVSRIKYELDCFDELREPVSAENRVSVEKLYDYYGASGVIDQIDFFNVEGDYLLIGEDGANLAMRNLPLVYPAHGKFWVNNHAHILKPKKRNHFDYFAYLLEAGDYSLFITGSTQPKLSQENLMRFPVLSVPYIEQEAISNYLTAKCAKIDSALDQKQTLLAKLTDYKKSLIYEAVTGKMEV